MKARLVPLSLAITLAVAAPHVHAQTVPWRAVIGNNSSVVVPGLPSTTRSYGDVLLSDAGAGRVDQFDERPGSRRIASHARMRAAARTNCCVVRSRSV